MKKEKMISYINQQIQGTSAKNIAATHGTILVLGGLAAMICYVLRVLPLVFSLGAVWAVSVIIYMAALVRKDQSLLILSDATAHTSISFAFQLLSYLTLSSSRKQSLLYLLCGMCMCIVCSIVSIIRLRKRMMEQTGEKKATISNVFLWGGVGGSISIYVIHVFRRLMPNYIMVIIIACISLILSMVFSFSAHLYQCFYWMKRYGYEKEL